MDFYNIKERSTKNGVLELFPDFKVCRSKDLMVRGKSFYAIWDDKKGLWSTDEYDVQRLVDEDLTERSKTVTSDGVISIKNMADFSTNSWADFRNYMNHISDNAHQLDEKLTFSNTEVKKKDYVSKRLSYPLEGGKFDAYDEIIGTLYAPDERAKLEWAIGAVISGDSKDIQKFVVLYGEGGAGKSTILNIIQKLFEGYYTAFEAKALTSTSNAFSTEVFKTNPLVAIQHDGDLSKIEDNTKLNSIISHEEMTMNEKYKPSYMARVNCFLFMATNKPVKITDAKSGIIRRLIDVKPSGNRIPAKKYQILMQQIDFELGAIASHCLEVYQNMGKNYYSSYRPIDMMFKTDVFFNFVEDSFEVFNTQNGTSLKAAYSMYKTYCDDSGAEYKLPMYKFREELKNYFDKFEDVVRIEDKQVRSYYSGFHKDRFTKSREIVKEEHPCSMSLDCDESLFDAQCADCLAQYASSTEKPSAKWLDVTTKLSELDTKKIHYVRLPENHIVIDFDLKDEKGEKSYDKNVEAASKWPPTYAELSKSGKGIHLHYIYDGDVRLLSRVYDDNIEVKVFNGNSSLRRKLTKCNNVPISHINSGLPLKGDKVVDFESLKNEKAIRTLIKKNLNKEIHPSTKSSIDFIYQILEDAHKSGMKYDITDLRPKVLAFANNSSNRADYCIKLVGRMQFKSEEQSVNKEEYAKENELVFFDVEVFPNLFVVVWKLKGKKCVIMLNPTSADIERIIKLKLIGFNCRRYDNHILYARLLGYTNLQLFTLSQRIINNSRNGLFGEAYNISYTDVYDFSSKKQSLKKFEIELGIHHQELGLPWDKDVPKELWPKVGEYCCNDVDATEATFDARKEDWIARQVLARLSGLTVNDTTQMHTAKIIFGNDKNPQEKFVYTDLSKMFPGYKFENGVSTYRGEVVGEGGEVYAEPGMYSDAALADIASMHPNSLKQLNLFGPYTQYFNELVDARLAVKHNDTKVLTTILDGLLLQVMKENPDISNDSFAYALKIAINIVYGLTSAKFPNKFKDPRNIDNIVAKRGALFMINLRHEVQDKGFKVAHIKTDSIKIPNATPEIIQFVMDYGKQYGYTFEHEATYKKFCLVNDAVYIAKYDSQGVRNKKVKHANEWTATGAQFAQPYVFKTLFSKESIKFEDMCETKTVNSSLYLDMNEKLEEGHDYHFIGKAGSFCPIKPGYGGGVLLREKDGKYYAATGSKGYRWLEAEVVKTLKKEEAIDRSYYSALVDDAVANISQYGDFEWLVSDDTLPWELPCPYDKKYASCAECPNWMHNAGASNTCKLGYDCLPF